MSRTDAAGARDTAGARTAGGTAIDVTILSSGHDVADARLHRHCAALRRAGLRVEVIAKGRADDAPDGAEFRASRSNGMTGRASRGLFDMLRAIELAPDWELDVVGPVAARDREQLDAWTAESPAAARVRLHGRMPPATAWRLARGAWVGMSLLHSTPAFESAI